MFLHLCARGIIFYGVVKVVACVRAKCALTRQIDVLYSIPRVPMSDVSGLWGWGRTQETHRLVRPFKSRAGDGGRPRSAKMGSINQTKPTP